MTNDTHSQQEEDTTEQDALQKLLDETMKVGQKLAKAVRSKANDKPDERDAALKEARKLFDTIADQVTPDTRNRVETFTPIDLIEAYWQKIEERKDAAGTGIASLDKALSGGLEQDRLMVLLGAPGSGKTTLVNQIADHVAGSGRPVLYTTSEDMPMALLAKTIARRGQLDYSAVQRGYPSEKARINQAFMLYRNQKSASLLRYLDATRGTTLDTIAEQAEVHFDAHKAEATGAGIIVVDYLQRLARGEGLGTDLRSSITVYTEKLREIACDLHCTVIGLCAMNRASGYHAGNSTIASAKESGDIDYTADVIMAIGEGIDEAGNVMSEPAPGMRQWMLRIDKNRQGETTYSKNHIYLDWWPARQQFTESRKEEDISQDSDKVAGKSSRRGRR